MTVWYVNSARAAVTLSTVLPVIVGSDPVMRQANTDVFRLEVDGVHETTSLWARSGDKVSPQRYDAATVEASGAAVPAVTVTPAAPRPGLGSASLKDGAITAADLGAGVIAQLGIHAGLTAGEELVPRISGASSTALDSSGMLHLSYGTARRTETITKIRTTTGSAQAAGLTLARMGIYSVAANGDLTRVAMTASDTTMWGTAFQTVERALTSSWAKTAGDRFAVAVLAVGTTMPQIHCGFPSQPNLPPRMSGQLAGQTDLPTSIAAGSVGDDYRMFQSFVLP